MSRGLGVASSFSNDLLQHMPIQCRIGHQALQPGILVTELPKLAHFEQPEVAIALLPVVVRRLADPHLPAHIRDRLTGVPLLQSKQDLLLVEPRLPHCFLSLPCKDPGST